MTEENSRRGRKLRALADALGQDILGALADVGVNEVMVNGDGAVWVDRSHGGRAPLGVKVAARRVELAIRLLADFTGATVNGAHPHASGAMPFGKARFQAELTPAVDAPILTIRKQAATVLTLMDLEDRGVITPPQHSAVLTALRDRKNIIIAGGTSSGKTTLANAMINSAAVCEDRLLIIEDTPELSCPAADHVRLRSSSDAPHLSAQALVKIALRLRPDRIIIGELRDGAAADLVKAWNTGHPGGLATLHANSAADAIVRLEALVLESQTPMPPSAIINAVDLVLFMSRIGDRRRVVELAFVEERHGGGFTLAPLAARKETTLG